MREEVPGIEDSQGRNDIEGDGFGVSKWEAGLWQLGPDAEEPGPAIQGI